MAFNLLTWNRLEGATRNENQIENALRFEVRDPLWLLTRQWQFGEFEGEDAGTAAFSRIETLRSAAGFSGKSGAEPQVFDFQKTPFEMAVESENCLPEIPLRLEMGRHFFRLLKKLISILFRPVSLSFRLYGNIFAGENILEAMQNIVPALAPILPIPFYFLELLVGLVQALVFTLLTAVFTLLICEHEEEHGGEAKAHD